MDLDSPDGREPPKIEDLRKTRSESRVAGLTRREALMSAETWMTNMDVLTPPETRRSRGGGPRGDGTEGIIWRPQHDRMTFSRVQIVS